MKNRIKTRVAVVIMAACLSIVFNSSMKINAATHTHNDGCYAASHRHSASCYKDYSLYSSGTPVVNHDAYHYNTQYSQTSYDNSFKPYAITLSNSNATKTYEYAYRLAEYSNEKDSSGFYVSFNFYTIAIMNDGIYSNAYGTESIHPDEASFAEIYLNGTLVQRQVLETTYVNHMGYYSGVLNVSIPGRVWSVGDIISVQLTVPYVNTLESTSINVNGWYNSTYKFKLVQLQRMCNTVSSRDIFQHNCTPPTSQNYCHNGSSYYLNPCNGTVKNVTTSSSSWSCNSHYTGGTQTITRGECSNCGPVIIARTATCCQQEETNYTVSNGVYKHNAYVILYNKTCGLEDGAYYTVYGTMAPYVCNKKINSIAVKNKTQTIIK